MKHSLLALTSLLVLLVIAQSSCQPVTGTPIETPPTETSATEPPAEGPPAEAPAIPLVPEDKPSLIIPDDQGVMSGAGISPAHAIGFVFPEGLVAMKATAVNNPYAKDNLTVVGVVELGEEAEKIAPGTYMVAIDLVNTESLVAGRLLPLQTEGGEQNLTFERTALARNPARADSPSFPPISPIISSNAVCFVVGFTDQLGEVSQNSANAKSWSRYCSLASIESGELVLSVQANFPSQFETLVGRWDQSIAHLADQGFPQDVTIDFNLTISEMEGHSNLNACNEKKECASDITGAPNASFWEDYVQAKDEAGGNNFVVTEGIVRIERLLEIPGQVTVQPGDYWLRDWFDAQENFLGTALLGVTTDNVPILGQTIPAIPAYFLDVENPQKVVSWISAWRCFNWCKFQSNCP